MYMYVHDVIVPEELLKNDPFCLDESINFTENSDLSPTGSWPSSSSSSSRFQLTSRDQLWKHMSL